ncbi:hypothetical protein HDU76_011163 [Blyttiomyces sp. JEL0837]|nr:hypothetical protein HDU76_011163 [Blyttiomyces sp. JEL0837]
MFSSQSKSVHVRNIPFQANSDDLAACLSKVGNVVGATIAKKCVGQDSGGRRLFISQGFGTVYFENHATAKKVVKQEKIVLMERTLEVSYNQYDVKWHPKLYAQRGLMLQSDTTPKNLRKLAEELSNPRDILHVYIPKVDGEFQDFWFIYYWVDGVVEMVADVEDGKQGVPGMNVFE